MHAAELIKAAFEGKLEVLRQILDIGAAQHQPGMLEEALHAAIENEQIECVRLLLSYEVDLEFIIWTMTPLAHAVDIAIDGTIQTGGAPGDEPTEIVELLLMAGAQPAPGLEVATTYRNQKFLELLSSNT